MINGKRIGWYVVAGPNTLGLTIILDIIERHYGVRPEPATVVNAASFDVLLVSLYWWEHKYEFARFLVDAGIDPRDRKPVIVAGGMEMLNPRTLEDWCHFSVLGDGEEVVIPLLEHVTGNTASIEGTTGSGVSVRDHVWVSGEENGETRHIAVYPRLRANHYVEDRTVKTTRIEIARGCKRKCAFCLLAFSKPYRELPGEAIKSLIYSAPTNTVALFSADRASHSAYLEMEEWTRRYGKKNTGTDLRIDTIQSFDVATNVRFGIEGFGYRARRAVGKNYTDDQIVAWFEHIFHKLKTPKGAPVTTATVYMIAGLPGDDEAGYAEFAALLRRIDALRPERFTMFLSTSTFAPYFHTPMQWASPEVWTDWNAAWARHRPHLEHITIAVRGGAIQPARRIMQMLAIRGEGQAAAKAIYNAARNVQMRRIMKEKGEVGGRRLLRVLDKAGVDTGALISELPIDARLPWDDIRSPIPRERLAKYYETVKRIASGHEKGVPEADLVRELEESGIQPVDCTHAT